jgi:hypothetical protein
MLLLTLLLLLVRDFNSSCFYFWHCIYCCFTVLAPTAIPTCGFQDQELCALYGTPSLRLGGVLCQEPGSHPSVYTP